MKVSKCMTRGVRTIGPDRTIQDAARVMAEMDVGALPVGEDDRLIGMVTDRDIAVRAVAEGRGSDTPIRDVMTQSVKYCFEDEEIEHVAENMGDEQVRRLPVLDRNKRLVGIVALGDIAQARKLRGPAAEALHDISRPASNGDDGARYNS